MSEYIFYVMDEKIKRRMGKWKYVFIIDAIIIAFMLGLLIWLKAIYFPFW